MFSSWIAAIFAYMAEAMVLVIAHGVSLKFINIAMIIVPGSQNSGSPMDGLIAWISNIEAIYAICIIVLLNISTKAKWTIHRQTVVTKLFPYCPKKFFPRSVEYDRLTLL